MVKIFIDPGHGGSDPGAVGNGISEKNITLQIANEVQRILKNEYDNILIKMSRTIDKTVSLSDRTNAANSWGADFYLSIHINSGGGTGFESYVYPAASSQTKKYQKSIHEEIIRQIDLRDRGQKQANFHVLRESHMPAILTENGFIDNATDANKLKSSSYINKIARGHVNGLAKALNLHKKAGGSGSNGSTSNSSNKNKQKTDPNTLYRVQIGAFGNRKNAEELAERARKAGFPVYITR